MADFLSSAPCSTRFQLAFIGSFGGLAISRNGKDPGKQARLMY